MMGVDAHQHRSSWQLKMAVAWWHSGSSSGENRTCAISGACTKRSANRRRDRSAGKTAGQDRRRALDVVLVAGGAPSTPTAAVLVGDRRVNSHVRRIRSSTGRSSGRQGRPRTSAESDIGRALSRDRRQACAGSIIRQPARISGPGQQTRQIMYTTACGKNETHRHSRVQPALAPRCRRDGAFKRRSGLRLAEPLERRGDLYEWSFFYRGGTLWCGGADAVAESIAPVTCTVWRGC